MRHLRMLLAAALCAVLAPTAFASGTATWELNSYADFIRGRFNGLSLSREGRLSLSPKIDTLFTSDQPVIWAVAQAPDGAIYAATGHRGRLYKIEGAAKSTLLWTAPEPEIFALAVDRSGAVYAATSPDGKVYRIENGKAAEYFAPEGALHLVAGRRPRWRPLRRHRRSGQGLPRGFRRQGRTLV